ncbi:MAG TPA: hypothetical protein VHA77_16965 [Xanthobacteraceae bacterium]|nr:hypothetical protein [Xanthobacteraceae bacterium]
MRARNQPQEVRRPEKIWTFAAGDRVPDWFMSQINCILTFDRDATIVERDYRFELYPAVPMAAMETIILMHVIDTRLDVEVDHVLPITTHLVPRGLSVN